MSRTLFKQYFLKILKQDTLKSIWKIYTEIDILEIYFQNTIALHWQPVNQYCIYQIHRRLHFELMVKHIEWSIMKTKNIIGKNNLHPHELCPAWLEDWKSLHGNGFNSALVSSPSDSEVALFAPWTAPAVLYGPELGARVVVNSITNQKNSMVSQLEWVEPACYT